MRRFAVAASSFVALAVLAAVTAASAGADTTVASFTLTAGALSISVPTGPVSLGTQVASTTATTITGTLGVVTVSDQRGGVTTWTASAIATSFTPVPTGPANPASNASYAAGVVTQSATVTATTYAVASLIGVSTIVSGASTGISTASWNPSISVIVPANYAPGVYSSTITHSVA